MISSAWPNYSEMGLEILDENTWLAVGRIDGPRNRMAQFITRDAGRSWRLDGGLNLPEESDVNVAPMIDDVTIAGRKVLLPSYCVRRPKVCWLRAGAPDRVAAGPQKWGRSLQFDRDFFGRSGYQSFAPGRDGKGLVGALVRERSDKKADIVVFRIPSLTGLAD